MTLSFDDFIENLSELNVGSNFSAKLVKAYKMLRDSQQLYYQIKPDTIFGVIKSQRDDNLIYACYLRADGSYMCLTQNGNKCGGLKGRTPCKHIMVMVLHIGQNLRTHATLSQWLENSLESSLKSIQEQRKQAGYVFHEFEHSISRGATAIRGSSIEYPGEGTSFNDIFQNLPVSENIVFFTETQFRVTMKILNIEPRKEQLLAEVYTSVSSPKVKEKILETENLALTYVMCVGLRIRVPYQEALDNGWKQCSVCNQWFSKEALEAFGGPGNDCPSSPLGLAKDHKIIIK